MYQKIIGVDFMDDNKKEFRDIADITGRANQISRGVTEEKHLPKEIADAATAQVLGTLVLRVVDRGK